VAPNDIPALARRLIGDENPTLRDGAAASAAMTKLDSHATVRRTELARALENERPSRRSRSIIVDAPSGHGEPGTQRRWIHRHMIAKSGTRAPSVRPPGRRNRCGRPHLTDRAGGQFVQEQLEPRAACAGWSRSPGILKRFEPGPGRRLSTQGRRNRVCDGARGAALKSADV
jgi:hypothetical protein